MQVVERPVLTLEKPPFIREALKTLAADVGAAGGEVHGSLKRLEQFAKEDCGKLILNLHSTERPLSGTPSEVRSVGAGLIGGVLVVTCQVSPQELLRIEVHTRRHFFLKHLISSFDTLLSRAVAWIRAAISRITRRIGRTKGNLGRIHARWEKRLSLK